MKNKILLFPVLGLSLLSACDNSANWVYSGEKMFNDFICLYKDGSPYAGLFLNLKYEVINEDPKTKNDKELGMKLASFF